ncbi:MAG: tetratricopeptide repeat protein, partial [Candidatus Sungbacteria bacterium]|nr:tetratricopeptide repeat protein [Candidatus Sungbacteria bacterium]
LMVTAALIPLWFLPLPVTLEFGREVTFSLLIIAAFILWLLSLLTQGEVRFPSSLILWSSSGLLALAFAVSTFFSKAPLVSLTFGDPLSEKFSTLALGIIFMLVVSSVLRKRDVKRMLSILICSSGIAALIVFFQLAWGFSLFGRLSSYAQGVQFNTIGTMNAFSLYLVTIFVMGLAALFSSSAISLNPKFKYGFIGTLVILLLDLMMIHFRIGWIVMLGSLIFLFGLMFMHMRSAVAGSDRDEKPKRRGLDWRYSTLIFLIAFSAVMLIAKTPVIGSPDLPAEVSPSFSATIAIGRQVLNEGTRTLLFGSGPTTFSLDWARYRDPLINQTQFWNVSFTQGFSWVSTMLATVGILGVIAFLLFVTAALAIFLRHLLKFPHEEHTPIGMSLFIGFIAMVFVSILYTSSFTFVIMFFLLAGLLMSALSHPETKSSHKEETRIAFGGEGLDVSEFEGITTLAIEPKKPGWLDITLRTIPLESSWLVFTSSLIAIFFLSLGVAGAYIEVGRLRAALTQQAAVALFNKGDVDGSIASFEQAVAFEDKNYASYVPLTQARMEKIRRLIQTASGGTNVQQEFQSTVSLAIQNSQAAIQLNPANSSLWRLQGSLYELLIPFIPGSENFAFSSYRKAIELDPLNPAIDIDLARAGLIAVDRLTLTIQQSSGSERDQLTAVRIEALQQIMSILQKAVEIKPDLADSHFLATQAALRLGNLPAAVQSAEKAKIGAPFDIGVAFQLGLLYYHANDIDKSQIEFERAVALNNNYSNARYFLGLIYDRKGDRQRAIQQFQQIEGLNPDNQEVKHVLQNLHAGKPALDGIVPPGQAPEKRNETPVKEEAKK